MIELLDRESLLTDAYIVRLMRASLSLVELENGLRGLSVVYTNRAVMQCDPSILLDCCRETQINPHHLTMRDVKHLTSSKHIAAFFQVSETDIWALAGYATNLTPFRERVDKQDKMH